jgi:hypothetical protein
VRVLGSLPLGGMEKKLEELSENGENYLGEEIFWRRGIEEYSEKDYFEK